jgi:hypothetical protein
MTASELRTEAGKQLHALIEGTTTREAASAWAMKYVLDGSLDIPDKSLWRALKALGGADARAGSDSYLYSTEDFKKWLNDLRDLTR